MRLTTKFLGCTILFFWLTSDVSLGQFTEVVSVTGQTEPTGDGTFSFFNSAEISNTGDVLFVGSLQGTSGGDADNFGLYRGNSSSLVEIAREGESPVGDPTFVLDRFDGYRINSNGLVMYRPHFNDGTSNFERKDRIFVSDGTTKTQIFETTQVPDDGGREIDSLSFSTSFNDNGQVVFSGSANPVTVDSRGTFVGDVNSGVLTIARSGDRSDDGLFSFDSLTSAIINNNGLVAFAPSLDEISGNQSRTGLYLDSVGGSRTEVVFGGTAAPDGNGDFNSFPIADYALNDNDEVVFNGRLSNTSSGANDGENLFHFDNNSSTYTKLVGAGDATSDGSATYLDFDRLKINNQSNGVTTVQLALASGDSSRDSALILFGLGGVEEIAREGELVPGGDGEFGELLGTNVRINQTNQIAFISDLTDSLIGTDDKAIYFFDSNSGLSEIVRVGDAFLGSTITDLVFTDDRSNRIVGPGGLNDFGQVAYVFELADSRRGIAIWNSVPEPTSLVGLFYLSLTCLFPRRRNLT